MRVLALLLATFAHAQDRLYTNGDILTMDAAGRTVEALATRNGRILATGPRQSVTSQLRPGYQTIDLKGHALLPGFYAAHDHFPAAGSVALYQVDLNSPPIGTITTLPQLIAALKQKAAITQPGEWIIGRGYDDTLLREGRHPTRHDLDLASTSHPIWIVHISGHLAVANTRALAIANITRATPQPAGGRIRLDSTGEPNGVIEESLGLVSRHLPALTPAQRRAAIVEAQKEYLARGVTTAVIAGASAQTMTDLDETVAAGALHLRISALIALASANRKIPITAPPDRIHTTGVKIIQDGSIQGYTGYLGAPYHKQPEGKQDYRGYASRSREELIRIVTRLHQDNTRVAIHGNGDAAIDDILEAFAAAQKLAPRPDARHRIEHCQMAREDQLARMSQLGVSPSFFVGHVFYWGDRHRDIFLGPTRAARISPLASALRNHLHITVHNDTPVTPVNPLLLVWAAVTRRTKDGDTLGKDQSIPVLDALRSITSEAAWQNFEETTRGTLEPNKLADMVILDRNPTKAAPADLANLQILETILGGETRHKRQF